VFRVYRFQKYNGCLSKGTLKLLKIVMVRCVSYVLVLVAALVGLTIKLDQDFEGLDNAFYELLPLVPAEHFANVAAIIVRIGTCELRSFIDFVGPPIGLCSSILDCNMDNGGQPDIRVAVAAAKGGSVVFARSLVDTAFHCGWCLGYGFRPSGEWPPPEETTPSYDADALVAIALVRQWHEYAMKQVEGRKENIFCVLMKREPLSRLTSMYLYFESAGEMFLRNASNYLKSLPDVDAKTRWMFDSMGKESMIRSHKHLVDSLEKGCTEISFEETTTRFNETFANVLAAWRVKPAVRQTLIDRISKKHDLTRRTPEQIAKDHHHTASKFQPGYKNEILAAFERNKDVMDLIESQRKDLGW